MKSVDEALRQHNGRIEGTEVVMSVGDFSRLVRYCQELQEANRKLNAQIEAYDAQFAKFAEEDDDEQPWLG